MDQRVPLYDADFFAWTQDQAAKLRRAQAERANLDIDFENVAEEVESMGRSQRRAVESSLARVVEHLLKLEHSPAIDPRQGWKSSAQLHRAEAQSELEDSPSLLGKIRVWDVYKLGAKYFELGLTKHRESIPALPVDCPYTLDQLLDESFFPPSRHGFSD